MTITYEKLLAKINAEAPNKTPRDRGIRYLAELIVENAISYRNVEATAKAKTNREFYLLGARDWKQYAEGSFAIVPNWEIAKRLAESENFEDETAPLGSWMKYQISLLKEAWSMVFNTIRTAAA